jgi:hypothetical protein
MEQMASCRLDMGTVQVKQDWHNVYCRIPQVRIILQLTRNSEKNYFAYFPYISHLLEVIDPNLMEINLSELILTSLNSI